MTQSLQEIRMNQFSSCLQVLGARVMKSFANYHDFSVVIFACTKRHFDITRGFPVGKNSMRGQLPESFILISRAISNFL